MVKVPGFEGMGEARAFAGVNVFYVASSGKNKAFAETLVADVAKDSTFAAAMFKVNPLPPVQNDLVEQPQGGQPRDGDLHRPGRFQRRPDALHP